MFAGCGYLETLGYIEAPNLMDKNHSHLTSIALLRGRIVFFSLQFENANKGFFCEQSDKH